MFHICKLKRVNTKDLHYSLFETNILNYTSVLKPLFLSTHVFICQPVLMVIQVCDLESQVLQLEAIFLMSIYTEGY